MVGTLGTLIKVKDEGKIIPVVFVGVPNATKTEARNYVEYIKARITTPLESVEVKMCDDGKVDVSYTAKGEKFERIRRITGYLVGTTDRWNDAKQSEERERVKHGVS